MSATKLTIRRASKAQAKARLALVGPAGAGKTYTALAVGSRIAQRCQGTMVLIESETGAADNYSDLCEFDLLSLDSHNPKRYIDAIGEVVKAGYAVVVIDSLSHAWMGVDGALEQVDKAAARSGSGNSFAAWRSVTPLYQRLLDTILTAPCHMIVTLRAKTEYVVEDGPGGKKTPRKIGLAPVMRDGIEYEFTVVGELDRDTHAMVITKSRCAALADEVITMPGVAFADTFYDWLVSGTAPAAAPLPQPAPATKADRQDDAEVRQDMAGAPMTNTERLAAACRQTADELRMDEAARKAVGRHWGSIWKTVKAEAGHADEPLEELPFEVLDDLLMVFREAISTEGRPDA